MLSVESVQASIKPLRLIFWGGLVCFFDFTISLDGASFDIFNDTLGMVLITFGANSLFRIEVHDRYASSMQFVQRIALISIFAGVIEYFFPEMPIIISFGLGIFGIIELVAIYVFCSALCMFCSEASLSSCVKSWKVTRNLFLYIYILPLSIFQLFSLWAMVSEEPLIFQPGPAVLIFLIIFFIPIIHLFVSTSRMSKGMEALAGLVDHYEDDDISLSDE
ncbi:hypothetical protein ACFL54_07260 [Planctomycetota bacterium]